MKKLTIILFSLVLTFGDACVESDSAGQVVGQLNAVSSGFGRQLSDAINRFSRQTNFFNLRKAKNRQSSNGTYTTSVRVKRNSSFRSSNSDELSNGLNERFRNKRGTSGSSFDGQRMASGFNGRNGTFGGRRNRNNNSSNNNAMNGRFRIRRNQTESNGYNGSQTGGLNARYGQNTSDNASNRRRIRGRNSSSGTNRNRNTGYRNNISDNRFNRGNGNQAPNEAYANVYGANDATNEQQSGNQRNRRNGRNRSGSNSSGSNSGAQMGNNEWSGSRNSFGSNGRRYGSPTNNDRTNNNQRVNRRANERSNSYSRESNGI